MHQGFEVIMLHFKEGSFNAVASVLVAAGTCKVSASTPFIKGLKSSRGGAADKAVSASTPSMKSKAVLQTPKSVKQKRIFNSAAMAAALVSTSTRIMKGLKSGAANPKGVLPTPKSAKQKRIFDSAAMAAALVAAAADNVEGRSGLLSGGSCGLDNSVRVRWSYKVLAQLASTAESEASSPAIVEWLTLAPPAEPTMPEFNVELEGTIPEGDEENAEEESPKKKDLEGPDSALPGTSALAALVGKTQSLSTTADLSTPGAKPTVAIVNRLLATVDKAAGWLDQLPAYGLLALSRLFQSLASDKHSRQLLPAAGKPITLLVKMYRSIKHKGPPEAVQEAQGQAEGFAEKVPNVRRTAATAGTQRHMPAAAGKLLPTPLLGSMAKELKELMKSSPTFEMPDLAWDGDASTVMEGKVAADPCSLPPATCMTAAKELYPVDATV
eukprot:gene3997-14077_t